MSDTDIKVSVIYLTYKGINLVKETIPLLIQSLSNIPFKTELIVVDNASNDGTKELILSYPNIIYLELEKNFGFSKGCNQGALKSRGEYLFFINNDIKVEGDFLSPLIKCTTHSPNVFAVGPKFLKWDRKTLDDAIRNPVFERGLIDTKLQHINLEKEQKMVFFLGGGFLVRKQLFFDFGLFDEIYTPFSWEDLDLGYRAVKRGFVNLYCPDVILYHKREATTKTQFKDNYFKSVVWKNKFIFMWSNFTDKDILRNHFIQLPWKLCKFLFNGRWPYVIGFFKALLSIKQIWFKRKKEIANFKLKDNHILSGSWKKLNP